MKKNMKKNFLSKKKKKFSFQKIKKTSFPKKKKKSPKKKQQTIYSYALACSTQLNLTRCIHFPLSNPTKAMGR
jgi:hypothetical protein